MTFPGQIETSLRFYLRIFGWYFIVLLIRCKRRKYKDEKSASYAILLFYFNNWKILRHNILLETISTKIYSSCEFGCVAFSHFDRWLSLSGHGEHHKACAKYGLYFPYLLSLSSTWCKFFYQQPLFAVYSYISLDLVRYIKEKGLT